MKDIAHGFASIAEGLGSIAASFSSLFGGSCHVTLRRLSRLQRDPNDALLFPHLDEPLWKCGPVDEVPKAVPPGHWQTVTRGTK